MNTPVIDAIVNYIKESNIPFSMPGHKNGRAFNVDIENFDFMRLLIEGDLTEVEGLDNLHKPEGAIKESLELLARAYKAKKSYFLVNGSTSGNLAMIFSAFKEGDKVLVDRGCHKSIFNGIIMRKLKPIYIQTMISEKLNMPLTIDVEEVKRYIKYEDIKGVVLTYPTYYGITYDLKEIIDQCRDNHVLSIVDCAHGAHFGFNDKLPKNPIELGANMAVVSAHKTLPALTQTAYLHIGEGIDTGLVDFYVGAFSTTSPSYMFMMTLDYARAYVNENGQEQYDNLIRLCDELREKLINHKVFKILSGEDLPKKFNLDPSRIIINCRKGYSGHKLLAYLRSEGIQGEMSDNSNVVLIPSMFSTAEDFQKLYRALKECPLEIIEKQEMIIEKGIIGEIIIKPYEAMIKEKVHISFKDAEGYVAGDNIIPYPPGIPIVMMGEMINHHVIKLIENYKDNNVTILGMEKDYIKVIKDFTR